MWLYKGKEITEADIEGYTNFVYLITNTKTGRKYIGKKTFHFKKTKKVKGKLRKQRSLKKSDWLTYYGSSDALRMDVDTLGPENFKREILHLCKSKGTANYFEAYEIMVHNAIISEDYYNEWLSVKVSKSQIKL